MMSGQSRLTRMKRQHQPPQGGMENAIRGINKELRQKGYVTDESHDHSGDDSGSSPSKARKTAVLRQMMEDMKSQNFDVIRFASYRTACKLRFIQKKTEMQLIDIWNVIETFRDNGLNTLEHQSEINISKLEQLISGMYFQLNKRLPLSQQVDAEACITMLVNWLLAAFDNAGASRMRVLSIKVSLAILCSGKLMDKLRYIFSQISDSNGLLIKSKFQDFLKEAASLAYAVFEGPSFGYSEVADKKCFDKKEKVTVNDFLDTMMSDPGPQCLLWLPLLHRMANVENVFHPVICDSCERESFMGFRYKCQRCYNFQLCQECFWRGKTAGSHTNDHEMKEYSSYVHRSASLGNVPTGSSCLITKSPAKQLSHSLRKSFRCVPSKGDSEIPRFPETPEPKLDLSNIVPVTPTAVRNGFAHDKSLNQTFDMSSLDGSRSGSASRSPSKHNTSIDSRLDSNKLDEEHRLIARYAARLAADMNNAARSPSEMALNTQEATRQQRELIMQLEAKNREIMREIQRLKKEQELAANEQSVSGHNPTLMAELRLLRQRKDELEMRMGALQESRRELMVQLEGLMKMLKNQGSPRSTPNSSPKSGMSGKSPPLGIPRSTPSTPGDPLAGVGGDVKLAFDQSSRVRNLRNDLLVAADSVTNAMTSLVRELNSEASGSDSDEECERQIEKIKGFEFTESGNQSSNWNNSRGQESNFLNQLRTRRFNQPTRSGSDSEAYANTDDADSYVRTDDDSYVATSDGEYRRTDDEYANAEHDDIVRRFEKIRQNHDIYRHQNSERSNARDHDSAASYSKTDERQGDSVEWEDSTKRWVNR